MSSARFSAHLIRTQLMRCACGTGGDGLSLFVVVWKSLVVWVPLACVLPISCADWMKSASESEVRPSAPVRFTEAKYSEGVLTLRWEDSSTIEEGYTVERSTEEAGDIFAVVSQLPANASEFSVTTSSPGRYLVAAFKGENRSDALMACLAYEDLDADGFGTVLMVWEGDCPTVGGTFDGGDCDDEDARRFPGNPDICDGIDNDCDDVVDGGIVFEDADGDGHGNPDVTAMGCEGRENVTLSGDDCDDDSPDRYPGNDDRCDGIDNDCDGLVDGGVLYRDLDGDGHGNPFVAALGCEGGQGFVRFGDDCDDNDKTLGPYEMDGGEIRGYPDFSSPAYLGPIDPPILPTYSGVVSCVLAQDGLIYCIESRDESLKSSLPLQVLVFDPAMNKSRNTSAQVPQGVTDLSCAETGSPKLYCVGSLISETEGEFPQTAGITVEYDTNRDTVSLLGSNIARSVRGHSCAGIQNGAVYCFGGRYGLTDSDQLSSDIFSFNPTNGQESLRSSTLEPARSNLSCARGPAGRIYCFGGRTKEAVIDEVVMYEPLADRIGVRSAKLPTGMADMSCAEGPGERIYCFGGNDGNWPVDWIIEYDPAADSIRKLSSAIPEAREGMSCSRGPHPYLYCNAGFGRGTLFGEEVRIGYRSIIKFLPPATVACPWAKWSASLGVSSVAPRE